MKQKNDFQVLNLRIY